MGNVLQAGGETVDGFRAQDLTYHALDAAGLGPVTYAAAPVYVTPSSGSIQRGVDAVSAGGAVNVQGVSYPAYVAGSKPVTVAFQSGASLALRADPIDPSRRALSATGTAAGDAVAFSPAAGGGVVKLVRAVVRPCRFGCSFYRR